MDALIRTVGVIVIALFMFAIPVLCTLSFALAWDGFIKVILLCACMLELVCVASCVDDMGERREE